MLLPRKSAYFLFVTIALLSSCAHSQTVTRGPIVGGVTDSSAVAVVRVDGSGAVAMEYSTSSDFSTNVIRTHAIAPTTDAQGFIQIPITELAASTRYYLRPVIAGAAQSTPYLRSFVTFPTATHDTSFVFAFGSCERQQLAKRKSNVWSLMAKSNPLLFLQLGDWTYPDEAFGAGFAGSDSVLASSYAAKYDPAQGIDSLLSGRAVDYVFDDHDFTGNNSDGTSPAKQNAVTAYDKYFPHYGLPNDSDGIYHSFTVGNVEFFVLDLRSQRSPNAEAVTMNGSSYAWQQPPGHSILRGTHTSGIDQLQWLEKELALSRARWKVIVSSVTWSPAAQSQIPLLVLYANLKHDPSKLYEAADKWVGYSADQDSLVSFIQRYRIKNVLVCSGDLHTAMMDDGKNSVFPEIVSGNLEVPNTDLYGELDSLGFGSTWDRGGQKHDSLNTFGRVTVLTSPKQQLLCEIVNEAGSVVASMTLDDSSATSNVRFATDPLPPYGVRIVSNHTGQLLAVVNIEKPSSATVYIADLNGRVIRTIAKGPIEPGTWKFRLSTGEMPSGTYLFVLETAAGRWSQKFEVTR